MLLYKMLHEDFSAETKVVLISFSGCYLSIYNQVSRAPAWNLWESLTFVNKTENDNRTLCSLLLELRNLFLALLVSEGIHYLRGQTHVPYVARE